MRVVACPPRFAPTPTIRPPIRVWADFAHLPTPLLCKVGPNLISAPKLGPTSHTCVPSALPSSPQHCVWAYFTHFAPTPIRVWADFAHLPTPLLCKVGLNTFLASRLGPALHTWRACRPIHPLAASFLPLSLPASLLFRVRADFAHLPTHILCKVGPNGIGAPKLWPTSHTYRRTYCAKWARTAWIHGCVDARLHGRMNVAADNGDLLRKKGRCWAILAD